MNNLLEQHMLLQLDTSFSSCLHHVHKMICIFSWNVDIDAKLSVFYVLFGPAFFFKCKVIVFRDGVHFEF